MREFNKLWAGQTISLLGSSITMFALPSLAVLVLHASPLQVGALGALETVPFPVLGLFVGVWADRLSRRTIMIVADGGRALALGSIPVAALVGRLHIEQLYVVAVLTGIGNVFFGITYQSYVPVLIERDKLTDANTKLEFSNSGSRIAGNALAGALIALVGAANAIAIDAVSYCASIWGLAAIRVRQTKHAGPELSFRQFMIELRDGVRVVLRSPDLRWIAGSTATTNLGGAMMNAVILVYAYRVLRLGPGLLGLVLGAAELGFVGALFAPRIRRRLGLRATLLIALLVAAAGEGFTLLAMLGVPYAMLFVSSLIVAVAVPVYNVNQISYRQALVDQNLQGRMNATIRTLVWGTLPAGFLLGGDLGNVVGAPQTLAIGVVISAFAAFWLGPFRERPILSDVTADRDPR